MALSYTERHKVLCRFKGEELKNVMDQQKLSAYMLGKAIGVYPAKIRDWKKRKYKPEKLCDIENR